MIGYTLLTAGTHSLTGSYSGDANYGSSSCGSLANQTVNPTSAYSISLATTPPSAVTGQAVSASLSVGLAVPGVLAATGTATFTVDGSSFAGNQVSLVPDPYNPAGASATATVSLPLSLLGASATAHTIAASYSGDTNYTSHSAISVGLRHRMPSGMWCLL
jgi:hypothetical protein